MGKSSASKEVMGMREGKMMMKKPKDMFPPTPKEHKGMDDLGYFTKPKMKPGTRRVGK